MSVKQAADLLDVSVSTVRRLCESGELISVRADNNYRQVTRLSVEEFMAKEVYEWNQLVAQALHLAEEKLDTVAAKRILDHVEKLCSNAEARGVDEAQTRNVKERIRHLRPFIIHKSGD